MFLKTLSVLDKQYTRRSATTTSDDNTEFLQQAFALNSQKVHPEDCTGTLLQQKLASLGDSKRDKISPVPTSGCPNNNLQVEDYDTCVEMWKSFLQHYQKDSQLLESLWFIEEVIFHPSDRVNRHNNCRI